MIVDLWTDGGCYPNPGPGAWAFVLVAYAAARPNMSRRHPSLVIGELERSGAVEYTTNNAMELTAAIMGLRALKTPTTVTVYSDSAYVVNGMSREWWKGWQARGWLNRERKPVANRELWEALVREARRHTITWEHVRGHTGRLYNERCDALCTAAYRPERASA